MKSHTTYLTYNIAARMDFRNIYHHNRTGEDNADAHHKRQILGREGYEQDAQDQQDE